MEFSKIRCGVAPLRIGTDRYDGLEEELWLCAFCNVIENEMNAI